MAADPEFTVRSDTSFNARIEREPDGIANCILITFSGEIVVSAFPSIFDAIRPGLPGEELNIISDYGAASLYANLNDLMSAYRHFHRHGIRIYRSVVIDSDAGRPLFQTFASAVAESIGLRAEFTHARDRPEAFATMRAMLGRSAGATAIPAATGSARPGDRQLMNRELMNELGRRLAPVSAGTDIEFLPGAIPNSFMVHASGRYDIADAEKVIATLGPNIAAETLNLICDERQAVVDMRPEALQGLYDSLLEIGIRRYNLVVVSDDLSRDQALRNAQDVARSRGIDARFARASFAEQAVVQLRSMLAAPEVPHRQA